MKAEWFTMEKILNSESEILNKYEIEIFKILNRGRKKRV